MRLRVRDRQRVLRYICRRDLKNKAKNEAEADKYGWGLDEKDLNDQQRQACVSASATVGAFLRYICRREQHYEDNRKYRTIKFGYGQDPNNLTEAQQQAYVSASSTVDACS